MASSIFSLKFLLHIGQRAVGAHTNTVDIQIHHLCVFTKKATDFGGMWRALRVYAQGWPT